MHCEKCNNKVDETMIFCPNCGNQLKSNVIDIVEDNTVEVKEKGPYKNFAKVGSVLGRISICTFWLLPVGLVCGILGIVFSSLGKKSKIRKQMANSGFNRSLTATILSFCFLTTIYTIVAIIKLLSYVI